MSSSLLSIYLNNDIEWYYISEIDKFDPEEGIVEFSLVDMKKFFSINRRIPSGKEIYSSNYNYNNYNNGNQLIDNFNKFFDIYDKNFKMLDEDDYNILAENDDLEINDDEYSSDNDEDIHPNIKYIKKNTSSLSSSSTSSFLTSTSSTDSSQKNLIHNSSSSIINNYILNKSISYSTCNESTKYMISTYNSYLNSIKIYSYYFNKKNILSYFITYNNDKELYFNDNNIYKKIFFIITQIINSYDIIYYNYLYFMFSIYSVIDTNTYYFLISYLPSNFLLLKYNDNISFIKLIESNNNIILNLNNIINSKNDIDSKNGIYSIKKTNFNIKINNNSINKLNNNNNDNNLLNYFTNIKKNYYENYIFKNNNILNKYENYLNYHLHKDNFLYYYIFISKNKKNNNFYNLNLLNYIFSIKNNYLNPNDFDDNDNIVNNKEITLENEKNEASKFYFFNQDTLLKKYDEYSNSNLLYCLFKSDYFDYNLFSKIKSLLTSSILLSSTSSTSSLLIFYLISNPNFNSSILEFLIKNDFLNIKIINNYRDKITNNNLVHEIFRSKNLNNKMIFLLIKNNLITLNNILELNSIDRSNCLSSLFRNRNLNIKMLIQLKDILFSNLESYSQYKKRSSTNSNSNSQSTSYHALDHLSLSEIEKKLDSIESIEKIPDSYYINIKETQKVEVENNEVEDEDEENDNDNENENINVSSTSEQIDYINDFTKIDSTTFWHILFSNSNFNVKILRFFLPILSNEIFNLKNNSSDIFLTHLFFNNSLSTKIFMLLYNKINPFHFFHYDSYSHNNLDTLFLNKNLNYNIIKLVLNKLNYNKNFFNSLKLKICLKNFDLNNIANIKNKKKLLDLYGEDIQSFISFFKTTYNYNLSELLSHEPIFTKEFLDEFDIYSQKLNEISYQNANQVIEIFEEDEEYYEDDDEDDDNVIESKYKNIINSIKKKIILEENNSNNNYESNNRKKLKQFDNEFTKLKFDKNIEYSNYSLIKKFFNKIKSSYNSNILLFLYYNIKKLNKIDNNFSLYDVKIENILDNYIIISKNHNINNYSGTTNNLWHFFFQSQIDESEKSNSIKKNFNKVVNLKNFILLSPVFNFEEMLVLNNFNRTSFELILRNEDIKYNLLYLILKFIPIDIIKSKLFGNDIKSNYFLNLSHISNNKKIYNLLVKTFYHSK